MTASNGSAGVVLWDGIECATRSETIQVLSIRSQPWYQWTTEAANE